MKEAKETWWPLFPGKIKEETKAEETRKIRERESSSRVSKSFSPFLPQVTLLSQFHQDKRGKKYSRHPPFEGNNFDFLGETRTAFDIS